jgi:hypothetical protein
MTCTAKMINHVNLVFHCCRDVLQVEPANSKKCTCLHTLAICSQTSNESHAIPVSTCSACICSKCQRASLPHQCIAEPLNAVFQDSTRLSGSTPSHCIQRSSSNVSDAWIPIIRRRTKGNIGKNFSCTRMGGMVSGVSKHCCASGMVWNNDSEL